MSRRSKFGGKLATRQVDDDDELKSAIYRGVKSSIRRLI
jgi:hypothetical protein